jgi:hypothetical protein
VLPSSHSVCTDSIIHLWRENALERAVSWLVSWWTSALASTQLCAPVPRLPRRLKCGTQRIRIKFFRSLLASLGSVPLRRSLSLGWHQGSLALGERDRRHSGLPRSFPSNQGVVRAGRRSLSSLCISLPLLVHSGCMDSRCRCSTFATKICKQILSAN